MKKGWGILLVSILISSLILMSLASAQVVINEVMPNPIDDCNDCTEWLEIYSNTPANISLWIVDAGGRNTTLEYFLEDYLVITKNKTEFLELWQVDSSKIVEGKTSLNNDGDTIIVYDANDGVIDTIDYPNIGQNESYSLDESWEICIPTPGQENYCEEEPEPQPECQDDEDCDDNDENTIDSCEQGTCFYEQITQQTQESFIEITDAPEEATFGDVIDIKMNIYRGDTRKYAVYVRVEDNEGKEVSEEVVLHVSTKYVNYSMKVPIQLRLNCDNKLGDEDYDIIVEGLDERTTKEIYLEGESSLCSSTTSSSSTSSTSSSTSSKTTTATTNTNSKNEPITYQNGNEEEPGEITGQVIETDSATTLKTIPYLLSVLCVLIVAYVIKSKNGK